MKLMRRPLRGRNTYVLDPPINCPCGNRAKWWIEMHNLDHCTTEPTISALRCDACNKITTARVNDVVELLPGLRCSTCDLTVNESRDLVLNHRRI